MFVLSKVKEILILAMFCLAQKNCQNWGIHISKISSILDLDRGIAIDEYIKTMEYPKKEFPKILVPGDNPQSTTDDDYDFTNMKHVPFLWHPPGSDY